MRISHSGRGCCETIAGGMRLPDVSSTSTLLIAQSDGKELNVHNM
jgi:hypothetical protein